jgi:pimeloyl-ACP methyl ester carboxylesterase
LRVQTIGSGPPAVLWHSLFVDSTTWTRVQQPLATARRLLLIDGPAHGGSPPVRRPFTLHDCVGAAIDVLYMHVADVAAVHLRGPGGELLTARAA